MNINGKKLYKSRVDRKFAGVCGGLAEYLDMDASLVRLITLLLIVPGGMSIWVYIIAALVIPDAPNGYNDNNYNNYNNNPYDSGNNGDNVNNGNNDNYNL